MFENSRRHIPAFCPLCVSRCGCEAVVENGRLVAIEPDPSHPTGKALCAKGRASPALVEAPDRLLYPLRRTRPKGDADPGWQRISWDEAVEFCKRLGQTERRKYRLPTEAEWEYACRAGTQSAYGGSGNLDEMGWYGDNSGDQRIDSVDLWNKDAANYFQRLVTQYKCHPHAVGGKQSNAFGLFDMLGNVEELCRTLGGGVVGRGGMFHLGPFGIRCAARKHRACSLSASKSTHQPP